MPLAISVPANFRLEVYSDIAPPPPQPGQVETDWSQAPVAILAGSQRPNVVLPVIPAGSTVFFRLRVTLPAGVQHGDDFLLSAFLGDPYLNPDPDPQVLDAFVAGARSYAERGIGVVLPPALDAELRQYATRQLQLAAESGRQSVMASLGAGTEVYSLAQLILDLARFGAARASAEASHSQETFIISSPRASMTPARDGPCGRGMLCPGESGGRDPNPVPTPDPNASRIPRGIPPGGLPRDA